MHGFLQRLKKTAGRVYTCKKATSAPPVKPKRKKTQRMKESQQQNKNKKVKRPFKPPAPSQDKTTTKDTF